MTQGVNLNWYFAVPVFSLEVSEAEAHATGLAELILSEKAKSPGIQRSNLNSWHSDNNAHQWNDPHVQWLIQSIGTFAKTSLQSLNGKSFQDQDLLLTAMWANVGERGAWHGPHHHIPSRWSGVYYVSVEPALSDENLSGRIEFMHPQPLVSAYGFPKSIAITPKNGLLLLFPSFLVHMVHPNLTNHPRITFAFNLDLKPSQKSAGKA